MPAKTIKNRIKTHAKLCFVPLALLVFLSVTGPLADNQSNRVSAESPSPQMSIILHRQDTFAEIFFLLPGEMVNGILGQKTDLIFSNNGRFPIDQFRINGNSELGQQLLRNIRATGNGENLELEAMSFMAHPDNTEFPFENPIDAVMAISICTNDYKFAKMTNENSVLVYGGFIDQLKNDIDLALHFPKTGRGEIKFQVAKFSNHRPVGLWNETLADGEKISFGVSDL
ncbi:MAG: hypothetical protein AAGA53_05440 [Pseudomonadota bacterium]